MEVEWTRVLIAFFCGYFLTLSGSLAQIVTNNKLASSSTLGFDGFAVIMILASQFFITFHHVNSSLEWLSFLLFLGSLFILYFLSTQWLKGKFNSTEKMQKIILIGLGFNLFIGGIFAIIQFLFIALNFEFPTGIWFGNFKYVSEGTTELFSVLFFATFLGINFLSKKLSYLSLGSKFAEGLGIDLDREVRYSLFLSLFLTGLVVSFFGVFSFVGLIFPHILRSFGLFKYSTRNELVIGPFFTGVVLSVMDFVCYQFPFFGAEVPVGMVCSVLGSFVLLALLIKGDNKASTLK